MASRAATTVDAGASECTVCEIKDCEQNNTGYPGGFKVLPAGLVAVCEISMMICEIASVNDMLRNDDATSIASYRRYFADWL